MTKLKLFLASYLSTQAATYFNRVLMVSSLAQHPDSKVSEYREAFFQNLRESGKNYVGNIQYASSIYSEMNLPELDLPRFPDDYFKWIDNFRKNLRASVPDKTEEQWIIDYAYFMGSICTDLAMLVWSLNLDLYAAAGPNQKPQIEKAISDSKNALFIWAGTSLLLGKNEQLSFMWEEFHLLDNLLHQLFEMGIPQNKAKMEDALRFADALLPKFHEKFDLIRTKLDGL